ncbi:MAG: diguanylate cyclase [Pseudomonadota bacterium]|nr:MAG: diguanylate cyclase [Pseudomonadota bacterium]
MAEITADPSLENLRDVLEYIDQGITMFDADLRLVVCNRRFLDMMDYPAEMGKVGTPFERFMRINAARGEYGEGDAETQVRERLELARQFQPHRFERQRPDGTMLEVIGRPLPRGGFVTTYTDVTEQRAAADAIRKARDELDLRVEQRTAELRQREKDLAEQTEALSITLEHMTQGITLADSQLKLRVCNRRFLELMDFPEWMGETGTPFEAFMRHNAERGEYGAGDVEAQVAERVAMAQQMRAHRFERVRPDGTVLEITGQPLAGGGFVTTYTDVTENHRSHERLHAILDTSPFGSVIWRLSDQRIIYSNQRFAAMCGRTVDDLLDTRIVNRHRAPSDAEQLIERFRAGEPIRDVEIQFRGPFGDAFWGLTTFEHFDYQNQGCVLEWVYDFTELHQVRTTLEHLAQHDPLTGLANRRLLQEHLDRTLAGAARRNGIVAVLFIDLDGFKALNDKHGHDFGDWVLSEMAARLESALRRSDLAARIGGDEFAVILDDLKGVGDAQAMAIRLLETLSMPCIRNELTTQLGASIGIALNDSAEADAETLLRFADRAMYRAKREGKGRCLFFDAEFDGDMQP